MRRAALLILLGGLAGVGCGHDGGSDRPGDAGTIRYVRSGGLAPIVEDLRVRPDGRATLSLDNPYQGEQGTTRFNVPLQQIDSIRASLEEAGFDELPEEAEITCADCYQHVITLDGYSVSRAETAIPAELEPALDQLSEIVEAYRPSSSAPTPDA